MILKFALSSVLSLTLVLSVHNHKWELTKDDGIITTYIGQNTGTGLRPTRSTMSVKRSVEQVYATILDIEKYPSWVPYCADASVLERSDSTIYFYQLLDMPLVKNRDIIIKAEIMELDNGLQVTMVAAPDKIKKDPDAIRITDFSAVYSITSKDSHSTLVELTNRVDPGGYIPNFAINWASRSQPYETFSNLKREITG